MLTTPFVAIKIQMKNDINDNINKTENNSNDNSNNHTCTKSDKENVMPNTDMNILVYLTIRH